MSSKAFERKAYVRIPFDLPPRFALPVPLAYLRAVIDAGLGDVPPQFLARVGVHRPGAPFDDSAE